MERTAYDESTDDPVQHLLPQHVKRALVYMRSNVAEKITLPRLAATCAVPERILLKQFKRFVGLSPLAYLRRLRLNLARGELLKADCDTAISEIAISCGFTHLGRFATEYRRAFDESPSATGQRVRSNGAGDASLPASVAWHDKPALLIVPFRTETLQEELDTRDPDGTPWRNPLPHVHRQRRAGASVPRPVVRRTAAARRRHPLCADRPPETGR